MKKAIILPVVFILFVINAAVAQAGTVDTTVVAGDSSKAAVDSIRELSSERDVIDVIHSIFKKKNQTGTDKIPRSKKRFQFSAFPPAPAYTVQTGFLVDLAANVAFYTSLDGNVNTSSILANVAYTQRSQLLVPIQTNIWTKNNKFNLLGDWRFYKYPQSTYGLGATTTTSEENPMDYYYIRFYQLVLRNIGHNLFLGGGYNLDYRWDITAEGTADGTVSDYQKYGAKAKTVSSGITLNFLYDNRRNSINPEKGFYTNAQLRNNFTFLGSDKNWESVLIDVRKYFKLSPTSKNVLALWSYNYFTLNGDPPYLDLPSNGWDTYNNTGRGYTQGRYRGKDMVDLEAEYRFGITRNRLLGGVIFGSTETFSEWPSNRFTKLLPAYGAGLRVQMNKHSRTNVAIDYSFGVKSPGGFSFNLGEVF